MLLCINFSCPAAKVVTSRDSFLGDHCADHTPLSVVWSTEAQATRSLLYEPFKLDSIHKRNVFCGCFLKLNNYYAKTMDSLHNRLTFDLGKKNRIFYYSWKEDAKISRIAEFGGELF